LSKAVFSAFPEPIKIYHNEGFHNDRHIELMLKSGAEVWHFGSDVHRDRRDCMKRSAMMSCCSAASTPMATC
jgi:hypothetical protein